ncbi:MAG: chloramphenicol acetyltransferase [Anaerolineae bacterium]|nr:chloramphenicol acetyltransferase [Anaerolineae bacterium]
MRVIDKETWSRREHFEFYRGFDHPYFGLSANVDVTAFYPEVKERGVSLTVAIVYLIARAANAIPEFRYRIRGQEVVEHRVVHPGTTILVNEEMFTFATFEYAEVFSPFAASAEAQLAYVREHPSLNVDAGRDDWLFMTPIPWVSFTSFMHPVHLHPPSSIPLFAWGKLFGDGQRMMMPLQAQGHHALMDGLHMGRFFQGVQDYLDRPQSLLGEA